MERVKDKNKGFTLIELLSVVVILAILASFAVPTFFDLLASRRLQQASESVYNDILKARSEAMKKGDEVYFSFSNGADWCYGVNNDSACNCKVADNCQFDGVTKIVKSDDFTNVSFNDSGFGGKTETHFEGIRGTASNTGVLKLTSNGKEVDITINKLGYVKICSNDLKRYKAC